MYIYIYCTLWCSCKQWHTSAPCAMNPNLLHEARTTLPFTLGRRGVQIFGDYYFCEICRHHVG